MLRKQVSVIVNHRDPMILFARIRELAPRLPAALPDEITGVLEYARDGGEELMVHSIESPKLIEFDGARYEFTMCGIGGGFCAKKVGDGSSSKYDATPLLEALNPRRQRG